MLRFNEIDPIDDGVLEERVYTINNNELEYKILNTYKVLTFAGN